MLRIDITRMTVLDNRGKDDSIPHLISNRNGNRGWVPDMPALTRK